VVDATQPEDPNAEDSEGNFYFPATDLIAGVRGRSRHADRR
jgi:hypothetical protein